MALVTVTLPAPKPGLNCKVTVGAVAVLVTLVLTKFTVPLTVEPATALAGKPAKLTLISAAVPTTLKMPVLLAGLVSFSALLVPVPLTPVLVWLKLIEALTVALGVTLTTLGAAGNVTAPVAAL